MTIDRRFALIATDGRVAFPYQKKQRRTGRYGFVLLRPGERDRDGGGDYVSDLETVIRRVVFERNSVRAKGAPGTGPKGDSIGLGKKSFNQYWISQDMRHLVEGAPTVPTEMPLGEGLLDFEAAFEAMEHMRPERFEAALLTIERQLTTEQRKMLVGHATADEHTASMQRIAQFGGYSSYSAANFQYGRLGGLLGEALGITGLANKTQAIGHAAHDDAEGHWQWTMWDALYDALGRLGWIEPVVDDTWEAVGAAAVIDQDPQCAQEPETVRKELINSRRGQGGYRKRMLRLWKGRCAVTECSVEAVLVASHAKDWETSSNRERLDEHNGLLLAASIDKLFDRGLICFRDDGTMLVDPGLNDDALLSVGLTRASRLTKVPARCIPYLQAHRSRFQFAD